MTGAVRRLVKGERGGTRDEGGFAIIIVLVALVMLSVLGAMSLLVMVSALRGVSNLKPEDKAFQVAEAALHVAHAKIVNNEIGDDAVELKDEGDILDGEYNIRIERVVGSTTDYVVCSEGIYRQKAGGQGEEEGTVYRRRIREEVSYSGMQAFDVMRKYLLFANNDINITLDDLFNLSVPATVNGSIRAERNVNIRNQPAVSLGDGLTFNGDVEGVSKVYVETAPKIAGGVNTKILGDIKTGMVGGPNNGVVDLYVDGGLVSGGKIGGAANFAWSLLHGWHTTDKWKIYCGTLLQRKNFWGDHFVGDRMNEPGCEPVYVPEPDFAYYKALAQEQHKLTGKNYVQGDLNLNGREINEFVPPGSSVAVIYATGNINLRGLLWNQGNVKATFICEGNFTSTETFTALYNMQCQVIAGGDATFNNSWSFPQIVRDDTAFFVWAGNDANINMGMWSGNSMQVTAMNDVNVSSANLFDLCWVRYRPPDVDIAGFSIDITVRDWRELPSEGS